MLRTQVVTVAGKTNDCFFFIYVLCVLQLRLALLRKNCIEIIIKFIGLFDVLIVCNLKILIKFEFEFVQLS